MNSLNPLFEWSHALLEMGALQQWISLVSACGWISCFLYMPFGVTVMLCVYYVLGEIPFIGTLLKDIIFV